MIEVQFRKRSDELVEELADYAHSAWSRWMKYLFKMSGTTMLGEVVIPAHLVARWDRQMNTKYDDLSEGEKESDREEAKIMLGIIYD